MHHIAFWFVIPLHETCMTERKYVFIYLIGEMQLKTICVWAMNSVHFIQDPNLTEGQNIQCASTQISSAQPCFACVIYPLLKPIWFPQRTLGWLPSISANLQTPREFWYPPDGALGKGEFPSMQRHRDISETGLCIAEECRASSSSLRQSQGTVNAIPRKMLRYLTPIWG